MKRSPMSRKKTKRLSDYDAEFEKMKPLVKFRSRGECEAVMVALAYQRVEPNQDAYEQFTAWHDRNCSRRAVHVHHRKYRWRGGTNAESNLAYLSRECHDYTHAHGGFGRAANLIGLALSAGESEEL